MGVDTQSGALAAAIVLVVEGDPDLRSNALAVIKEAELNSMEAKSAEDALVYLREHAPDVGLILSSLKLRGRLVGIDLARLALFRWPWIKVLVTSGDARLRDIPQNVVLLPKPWTAVDIRAHLDWEVARARATEVARARATDAQVRLGHRVH